MRWACSNSSESCPKGWVRRVEQRPNALPTCRLTTAMLGAAHNQAFRAAREDRNPVTARLSWLSRVTRTPAEYMASGPHRPCGGYMTAATSRISPPCASLRLGLR